ncbi:hypothetical protein C0033_12125 [Clostridium sp. chh4-2]|uniref:response regulator transcription factor n=1 Tax=Clostridium sp. chh4-2 TaxID=2067550 RepID=UPI000CCDC4C7|nr:response regulator [Clostridium sp. chh4-2]PNV61634.1 hypothetical protein C0033_12125 [Clostridium sp. chh4-2]
MLKMIIADDERIIRESIYNLIQWDKLGIEIIGLCENGIEAYDMILDESPDIVLTDIKMSGMSGLEVISRIRENDPDIQFILLSGYDEFEYAREAMKYGVRHYILKPCDETEILPSIQEAIQECYHKRIFRQTEKQQKIFRETMSNNIIVNIVNEFISSDKTLEQILTSYEQFLNFENEGYCLYYIYYLEEASLNNFWKMVRQYGQTHFPYIPVYGIYGACTLILFFQDYVTGHQEFEEFLRSIQFENKIVDVELKSEHYKNLFSLLEEILPRLKRSGAIYLPDNDRMVPSFNYHNLLTRTEKLLTSITTTSSPEFLELLEILGSVHEPEFFKHLVSGILWKICSHNSSCSPLDSAEFLIHMDTVTDTEQLQELVRKKLNELFEHPIHNVTSYSYCINQVIEYVDQYISNPNLTLKWICEKKLYMDMNYVSKKFQKETGQKFSKYLTDQRIQKAKELIARHDVDKIQTLANLVGCGNNPRYFSQIFKKKTGMTPGFYIKKLYGGTNNDN